TGMRAPVDGVLLADLAHTDRSFLTGESAPIRHSRDADLCAGEVNLGAPFEMRVTAVGAQTRLHQIARLVETAEHARNHYTTLADRAAQVYAPAVHLLGLATFLGWFALTQDLRLALNIAISVLIITCPCALGLAVPAVSTAAISALYRLGFLVKSGTALERLSEVKTVLFDKTGTLTKPGFVFDPKALSARDLSIAKALAQASAHPLSRALDSFLGPQKLAALSDVSEHPGKGLSATFGAVPVALGQADWLGGTGRGLALRIGGTYHALPYEETLKPGLKDMTGVLARDGYSLEILSGDTAQKTADLAQRVGIARYHAPMTPEEKCDHVAALSAAGQSPCMVGDGLNDTVALASAHASIAPGTALDAARNAADVVVLGKSLGDIPKLLRVARAAVRLSRQNFAIALVYNCIAVPIAVLGHATPLMAALAMSLSSITVLLNALRVGWIQ
ncbi:MAG: heavy metal translocating P-type ATPase, partial [Pseudomonadota bacterium]